MNSTSVTVKALMICLVLTTCFATAVMLIADENERSGNDRDRSEETKSAINSGRARSVILFLGDGMGDSEITIARNYSAGAQGRLNLDKLPFTGAYTTFAVQESHPNLPDYVTDSAASGTAWATGHKTSNGRISTKAGSTDVAPFPTILELAKAAGYKTGDVSTAEVTDATPAVLAAHVNERACQGPADMKPCMPYKKLNGGPGSIAEQMVDHQIDVILGGGRQRFAQIIDGGAYTGKTVVDAAVARGYSVITDISSLAGATNRQPILGLFTPGNMSPEWKGKLAVPFPGSGPQKCAENQRPRNEPSLTEMTAKALELLDKNSDGQPSKGFFLQVEGASIDKQDHAQNPCGQIGETVAFDKAIAVGLAFAKSHPDTLVIVTADHAHTSQIIEAVDPGQKNHPGAYSVLTTADGVDMTINYATEPPGQSQSHTGSQVRIAAQGPQAVNVLGVTDQTDLFRTIARALALE